jgi:hypothetical protein
MEKSYKGYTITAKRERSLGGDILLYYSVFRDSDGYECVTNFTTGDDTIRDYIRYMKQRIDAELASDDPWGEKAYNDYRNKNVYTY